MKSIAREIIRGRAVGVRWVCAAVLAMGFAHVGQADVVVTEDFSYPDGIVGGGGQNGGAGWAGAWDASSSVNSPSNEFTISSGQAVFTGNTANQEVITHDRGLGSAITVGTLETVTIDFDLVIGPSDGQAGRGIGLNFVDSGAVAFTLAKRINAGIGVFADGLGTGSAQLSDAAITQAAGTTYNLTATLTYDGADSTILLSDGNTDLTAVLAGTQVSFDTVQLTGYHRLTTGNGVDNLSIDVTVIPEPATGLLLLLGMGLVLGRRGRARG